MPTVHCIDTTYKVLLSLFQLVRAMYTGWHMLGNGACSSISFIDLYLLNSNAEFNTQTNYCKAAKYETNLIKYETVMM